jgi:transposase
MGKAGRPRGLTFKVELEPEQRQQFEVFQRYGKHSARVLSRMRIVLLADDGIEADDIAKQERVCKQTVVNTLKRFVTTGSVEDKSRSGRPEKLSGEIKAHIIATACTDAPKGRTRWTLRLLAEQLIQLELVDSLSKDTVGKILKKTS